jgi:uncharacterized protein YhfF
LCTCPYIQHTGDGSTYGPGTSPQPASTAESDANSTAVVSGSRAATQRHKQTQQEQQQPLLVPGATAAVSVNKQQQQQAHVQAAHVYVKGVPTHGVVAGIAAASTISR